LAQPAGFASRCNFPQRPWPASLPEAHRHAGAASGSRAPPRAWVVSGLAAADELRGLRLALVPGCRQDRRNGPVGTEALPAPRVPVEDRRSLISVVLLCRWSGGESR